MTTQQTSVSPKTTLILISLVNAALFGVMWYWIGVGGAIVMGISGVFTFIFAYGCGSDVGYDLGKKEANKRWRLYIEQEETPVDSPDKKFIECYIKNPRQKADHLESKIKLIEQGMIFVGEDGKNRRAVPAHYGNTYSPPTGHIAEIDRVINQAEGATKKPSRYKQKRKNKHGNQPNGQHE